ncbi:Rab family GTPase [Allomuricauda sp. SCSIO 65647]|uniref:Rab family GTPase n=1 Tax=Allomuricauda sp. SCSIO 65647 TaxID=2908843 RepID=UPI001F3E3A82|nr:Rab family GTPase [Muricauda sp. SCSIO 65647]UJH69153.1 GTP-binding protein [Muricauda sp. SCSIO 65647]
MQKSKKIVILGHFGVGKTSLIRRFVKNSFSDKYKVTIGVHISKKVVEVGSDESISMILWDLEGTDDIRMIRNPYLLGTHGAFFVFDVNRPSTFQNIQEDLSVLSEKMPDVPLLIIGNKVDLVDQDDLNLLLKENDISFDFLTSAKTGEWVEDAFLQMATLLKDA